MLRKPARFEYDTKWETLLKEPTVELARLIVEASDRVALEVLLETRRLFRLGEEPLLLLPDFLMKICDRMPSWKGFDTSDGRLADCAYDLMIAKYSHFPETIAKGSKPNECPLKGMRIDCRKYYKAFVTVFEKQRRQKRMATRAEEEVEAGKLLQRLVVRNFWWSKKECERGTSFAIRYAWKVESATIYLWYPSHMTAREFRMWLEENVTNVNPRAPNEKKRIQALIDKNLGRGSHVSLDEPVSLRLLKGKDDIPSIETQEGRMFARNLADAVAREKAENIDNLRPAIKGLGKKSLRNLILQIFSEIEHDEFILTRVASRYGLSKASLSRFAGSSWFEKMAGTQTVNVPDLWKNTAGLLAENSIFMDTVLASGYAGKLKDVLEVIGLERRQKE
jgi:hypothetical protein